MLNTNCIGSLHRVPAFILINRPVRRVKSNAVEPVNDYNPWACFPIHLSPKEINSPLSVIAAFFDDEQLPGQLAMLKAWREFVVKPDYYRGPKDNPSALLYFHKLNIALVEAVYLLTQNSATNGLNLSCEELAKEKKTWAAYPVFLATSELSDPFLFLQGLFASYTLPDYREQLGGWLEYGLSRYPAAEFVSAVDLITVYDNLQKLYEAAWVINQRDSARPYLRLPPEKGKVVASDIVSMDQPISISLYQLDKDILLSGAGLFSQLVNVIRRKVPSVQAVIYLGTPPNKQSPMFLLILTSNDEREQAQALAATVEESCRGLAEVVALVHHGSAIFTGLENNNVFFRKALTCPVIYLSGELLLPAAKPLNDGGLNNQDTTDQRKRWQKQGMDFLNGASYHLEKGSANAALFCLHQSVESMLIAILRAVTGYRINNHNLSTLLRLTKMFTTDLAQVFAPDTNEGKELFHLLKHAYVNIRYKDSFEADHASVQILYPVVQHFVSVTSKIYHKHLLISNI